MTAPDVNADVRARFEAWLAREMNDAEPMKKRNGDYMDPETRNLWLAWQARGADLSGEVRELVEADRAVDEADAALRRLAMAGPRPGSYGTGWELRDAAHKQRLMDTLDAALERRAAALAKFTQEKP